MSTPAPPVPDDGLAQLLLEPLGGDPLAGLSRPAGDPSAIRAHATKLSGVSDNHDLAASRVSAGAEVALADWNGEAAEAYDAYAGLLNGALTGASTAYAAAAAALVTYAGSLETAQSDYDAAAKLGAQVVANAKAAAQHPQPAPPPMPYPYTAQPPSDTFDPMWSQARTRAEQAIADADAAATKAAAALDGQTDELKPPPAPPKKAYHWYTPFEEFGDGVWDSLSSLGKMLYGISTIEFLNDPGKFLDNWENLGKGLGHDVTHPWDFAGQVIDWDDLSHGRFFKWLGELAPSAVAAFFTGGGAEALRAGDGLTLADRAALAFRASTAGVRGLAEAALALKNGIPDLLPKGFVLAADGFAIPVGDVRSLRDLMTEMRAKRSLGGVTPGPDLQKTIDQLGGRVPINGRYAGKVFDLPGSLGKLYPDGVRFTKAGFPDFSPYSIKTVTLPDGFTDRTADFAAANKAAGLPKTPPGYTWHHVEDGKTLQLVPRNLHEAVRHTGGIKMSSLDEN